ncbi:hypothetical protein CH302_01950 [Rhodococcus sp. 15-2388-1-1a]|nr:hypothetical protein CH302_01950 [Rhodococcus sp. 15-2388-1-1a]
MNPDELDSVATQFGVARTGRAGASGQPTLLQPRRRRRKRFDTVLHRAKFPKESTAKHPSPPCATSR